MTAFKTVFQKTLRASFLLVCSGVACNSYAADNAQQLYTSQPDVTPELGKRGAYSVGVRTIQATNPQQLSVKDYQSLEDRTLTLEVWYPAVTQETDARPNYKLSLKHT